MKEQLTLTALAILSLAFASCNPTPKEVWGEKIVACGDDKVLIIDASQSTPDSAAIIWKWQIDEAMGQIPEEYKNRNRSIDDCKVVDGGSKLLITSSSNSTILLDIATKKCLFWAYTPMAHSAEYLPGDRIIVANSTTPLGNSLELYDAGKPEQVIWKDSLYFGHGTVWMEKYERLYTLGYKEMRVYRLENWNSEHPSLVQEKVYEIPGTGGHDLNRISKDALLMTNHEGVYVFDIQNETFTPFQPLEGVENIKSVNYNPQTGQTIYTKAEISWWTHHLYSSNPSWTITVEDVDLYKVRTVATLP